MAPVAAFQLNTGVSVVSTGPGELELPGEFNVGGFAENSCVVQNKENIASDVIVFIFSLLRKGNFA